MALLILSVSAVTAGFAQSMQSGMNLPKKETTSRSLRGANLALEEKLKELEKRKTELKKLVEYIPIEGAVDENTYIVGPGDQFTLSIAGGVEEQYQINVGADGSVVLPFTKGVSVAGSNLAEAKRAMKSSLATVLREGDLTISLTTARLFIINVVGMVNFPGEQTVSAAGRVFSGIELAGGKLPSGDLSRVRLLRAGSETTLDLTKFLYSGDLSQNPTLLDGDIVVVPGTDLTESVVFLFGAGYSGTLVNISQGETAGAVLRRVGADREKIDLSDLALIRGGELFKIDLLSESANSPLQGGDSLFFKDLPDSVYVGGKVTSGGAVPYIAGADYRAYIAMAGGVSLEGGIGQTKIIRDGEKLSPKKAGMIRRGDVVLVGTSPWYVINEAFKSLGSVGTFASAVYVIGFRD